MKHQKTLDQTQRIIALSILITLMLALSSTTNLHPSAITSQFQPSIADPLGHVEGTGSPASISWLPNDQKIVNPSFETGSLAPWVPVQYNAAAGSTATITSPGYNGTHSAELTVFSGNFTASSFVSLLDDLSQQQVGFSSGVSLRAAVFLQKLNGTSTGDRVELSLNLTSATGGTRAIHYVLADGSSLPTNSTTDAYYLAGTSLTGQWVTINRDVATDTLAAFPSSYPSLDAVSLVSLTVYSKTQAGPPNIDPHIRFWNSPGGPSWTGGEAVVYDADNNGVFDSGDSIIGGCNSLSSPPYVYNVTCASPSIGTTLSSDPLIKFVDKNGNGVWDPGEPVIYDCNTGIPAQCNDNTYDFFDPIIAGSAPPVGTPLTKIIHAETSSLFDTIELYSPGGGIEWVRNGGFESGLSNWAANSSFTPSTSPVQSGAYSAQGSVTSGSAEMAQTMDAKPQIDTSTTFTASVNMAAMTGTSSTDIVDIWLGLVDSQYNPVSLYYVFKTGDGSIPSNRTDSVYRRVSGFGSLSQWLTVNDSLMQDTSSLNLLGFRPPYSIEIIVLEVNSPSASSTTTAYFDDLSIHSTVSSSTLPSTYHAVDGQNTTYAYTISAVPQASLYLEMPRAETILNITTPEDTALLQNQYTTALATTCSLKPCIPNPRTLDIPDTTLAKYPSTGNWEIYATATNALANVYTEDPTTHNPDPSPNIGSTVNLVSQAKDPLGGLIQGAPANLTLWNTANGAEVGAWAGSTSTLGWWNVSSVTLPPIGSPPGIYRLQATVVSTYVGIRTFQVLIRYQVTVVLNTSSNQISAGATITISGTVTQTGTSTPVQGVNVTVSYRPPGTSQWTVLGNATTDSLGHFSYNWTPPQGNYQVEALTGDSQTAPTESTPFQLSVGPPGFLQQYWPLLIGIASAAVAIAAIFIVWRQRKGTQMKTPPRQKPGARPARPK